MKKILCAGLLLAASNLFAQTTEHPPVVEKIKQGGVKIQHSFAIPKELEGQLDKQAFLATYYGQAIAIYVSQDQQHAIIGTLVNVDGTDLTGPIIEEKITRPQSAFIWEKLSQANWIRDGKKDAEKIVYVFNDPECMYCKMQWEVIRPWVDAGKIEVRNIMVAVLDKSSEGKSAYIMGHKDPAKALHDHESGKHPAEAVKKISDEQRQKLDANMQLMASLGFSGTPSLLYKDDKDLVQFHGGMLMGEQLEAILGPEPK